MKTIPSDSYIDKVTRAVFEDFPVRVIHLQLRDSWQQIGDQREYPENIRRILSEALISTTIMAANIKFEGRVSLQLTAEQAPLKLLVAQCTNELHVRATASWQATTQDSQNFSEIVDGGMMAVTLENHMTGKQYQGAVALDRPDLPACIEQYFERSEQLPSQLKIASNGNTASGILIQQMPADDDKIKSNDSDGWNRIQHLLNTVTDDELLTLSGDELFRRLFHQENLRSLGSLPVAARCQCSRERLGKIIVGLGREEAEEIVAAQGKIEINCDFCNSDYVFDAVDVASLFTETAPSSDLTH